MKRDIFMSVENIREKGIGRTHLPKTREAVRHDATGERERLSPGGTATGSTALRRVISNPISGEQIVIRTSGAETNGKLLVFDLFLPPGKQVPSRHRHPVQEERFTILAGTMRFRRGWRSILAISGDTIVIPPGIAHWFGNVGTEMVHARVEVRPALRMEELLATAATIEVGPRYSIRHSVRQLPALARLLIEFQHEVAVPDLAAWLVRPILAVIARLDRRLAKTDKKGPAHGSS
jgi:quercetin dioxygenase-like cupin family protein